MCETCDAVKKLAHPDQFQTCEWCKYQKSNCHCPTPDVQPEKRKTTCTCGESTIVHRVDGPCWCIDQPNTEYKPPVPEPEKCDCLPDGDCRVDNETSCGGFGHQPCKCNGHKPSPAVDPVEEEVRTIWMGYTQEEGVKKLMELLARKGR